MFPWPQVSAADAVMAIRWIMAIVALAALAWVVTALAKRKERIETDVAEGIRSAS
jgi:short subunit fatty acids transporter